MAEAQKDLKDAAALLVGSIADNAFKAESLKIGKACTSTVNDVLQTTAEQVLLQQQNLNLLVQKNL